VTDLRREACTFALRLFDLFRGPHHTLLLYGSAPAEAADSSGLAELVEGLRRRSGDRIKAYRILPPDADIRAAAPLSPTLSDAGGHFQHIYAATAAAAYLVRPDGYVGYRTDVLRWDALAAYLGRIFAPFMSR
jgi:hypothetical protein